MPRLNGQSPQEPPWSRRSLISTVGDWDESSTRSGTIGKLASHRQKNVDEEGDILAGTVPNQPTELVTVSVGNATPPKRWWEFWR